MEEIQILALKIKTQIIILIKIKKDGNRDFEEEIEGNERTHNLSL